MNKTLLGFIKKELVQTLRDKRMRIVLFVMPIVQLSLFGIAISNEIKNVRLAAPFVHNDPVLEHILDRSYASGWFVPANAATSDDPYTLIESGQADVVIVPQPGGFTHGVNRREGKLQLLINAVNATKAQAIEGYLTRIVGQTVQDDLQYSVPPAAVQLSTRVLFNPDLKTSVFMVPGTMCMVMVITTMVMANIAIVREKEMGTFEMLISAPVSRTEVIFGKTIPYVILGMSNFPLILGVATLGFGVPMRGSFAVLFLAVFAFVCTAVAIGTLISTFCENQQQATLAGFLVMFPMIMFSGLMFPVENMPPAIRWVSAIDPLTHFMGVLRNIMLKGGGAHFVTVHVGILAFIACVVTLVSFRRFHTTL